MTDLKWKTVASKTVYKGKLLTLFNEEVITPDNKKVIYDIVDRKDIVLAIPKVGEHFYMVDQYRYAIKSSSLEFPQGFCEEGENIYDSVQREFEEETGLHANKITKLNTLWVSSGFLRQEVTIFLVEDFVKGKQSLGAAEYGLTLKELTLKDISKRIATGEISNAPTIAGIGLYLLALSH